MRNTVQKSGGIASPLGELSIEMEGSQTTLIKIKEQDEKDECQMVVQYQSLESEETKLSRPSIRKGLWVMILPVRECANDYYYAIV